MSYLKFGLVQTKIETRKIFYFPEMQKIIKLNKSENLKVKKLKQTFFSISN